MMPEMLREAQAGRDDPQPVLDPKRIFESMELSQGDCLANLRLVIHYLRGSKLLRIPRDWRPLLPDSI